MGIKNPIIGLLALGSALSCTASDPNAVVCALRNSTPEDKRRALSEEIDLGTLEGKVGWFQDAYASALLDASESASPAVVAVVERTFDLRKAVLLERITRAGQGIPAQQETAAIGRAVDAADAELGSLCG